MVEYFLILIEKDMFSETKFKFLLVFLIFIQFGDSEYNSEVLHKTVTTVLLLHTKHIFSWKHARKKIRTKNSGVWPI